MKTTRLELHASELQESVKLGYPLTEPVSLSILKDLADSFDSFKVTEREAITILYNALYPMNEESKGTNGL
jgi:hypothetical protein